MAGTDTIRGVAFQQAFTVHLAIEVLGDPEVVALRVEGEDDAIDIEVLGPDESVRRAIQVKTRQEQYTWGESDLLGIIDRWTTLGPAESTAFEFVTNGRLGPTGEALKEALHQARLGDNSRLAETLEYADDSPQIAVLKRASIVRMDTSGDALMNAATYKLRRMLPNVRNNADALSRAASSVNALFRELFDVASQPAPGDRILTSEELAKLLDVDPAQQSDLPWEDQLRARILEGQSSPHSPGLFELDTAFLVPAQLSDGAEDIGIQALYQAESAILLHGYSGSGKSTALEQASRLAASDSHVVILAHAESYVPGRLDTLIADAISRATDLSVSRTVGASALFDPDVTIVVDGASEISSSNRDELREDLHAILDSRHSAGIVLAGRDVSALRSILPVTAVPKILTVNNLSREDRLAVVDATLGAQPRTGNASSPTTANSLLTHIETVLEDALDNTLLFRMALFLAADGRDISNRIGVYQDFTELVSQRTGADGLDVAMSAAGIAYSELLDSGRRHANAVEWSLLMGRAAAHLNAAGVSCDSASAMEALTRSGLVTSLGFGETVAPMHDSLADFMSAKVIGLGLAHLPDEVGANDELRLSFALELGIDSLPSVVRDIPFAISRLRKWSPEVLNQALPTILEESASSLLPPGALTQFLVWRAQSGLVIFPNMNRTGWVSESDALTLSNSNAFLSTTKVDTWAAIDLVWRRFIVRHARLPSGDPISPLLNSQTEARDALVQYDTRHAAAISFLVTATFHPRLHSIVLQAVGGLHLVATIFAREPGDDSMFPIVYSYGDSTAIDAHDAPLELPPAFTAYSQSHVESRLRTGPENDAVKRVQTAIESLTTSMWL